MVPKEPLLQNRKSWRVCAAIATLALAGAAAESASAAITPTGNATDLANAVVAAPGTVGSGGTSWLGPRWGWACCRMPPRLR